MKMSLKQSVVLVFLLCCSLSVSAYTPITEDRLKELLAEFNYTPTVQISILPKASCVGQDLEYTTTYPQRTTVLNIKAKAFIPSVQNVPVVFMLPPLGGINQLDQSMAETFCKHNIAAIIITTNMTGLDSDTLVPVSDHDHTHRRVASAIKGGIIVAQSFAEINTAKVGLFGVSLGGILGSVAYGVIPQISAATFLVNGGDVPHILAYSDQASIVKVRTARMKEQGLETFEEYEAYLRRNLTLDPLHFAKLVNTDSTRLYLSRTDKSVPSEKQIEYYQTIGSPQETSFYSLNHIKTIVAVLGFGDNKTKIAKWFSARFAQQNPRLREH